MRKFFGTGSFGVQRDGLAGQSARLPGTLHIAREPIRCKQSTGNVTPEHLLGRKNMPFAVYAVYSRLWAEKKTMPFAV
jgi:hypothetical protein